MSFTYSSSTKPKKGVAQLTVSGSGNVGIGTVSGSSNLIISGSPSSSSSIIFSTAVKKYTYNILGEEVESESSYADMNLAIVVSTINILGIRYYEDLKKQGVSFNGRLEEFLEDKLRVYYRDNKIEKILEIPN